MLFLDCLGPNQLIIFIALLTIVITEGMDADQLNTIGNFLTVLSDSILAKAAQMEAQQSNEDKKQDLQNQIEDLQNQLKLLC